jgi:predicted permease
METRPEKDAKTVLIARALLLFVVVLVGGSVVLWLAGRAGITVHDEWTQPLAAAAALATSAYLLRHRDRRRR